MPKKPLVVDFHAHILEPHVLKVSSGRTVTTGFGAIAELPRTPGSRREQWYRQMMDPEAHLEGLALQLRYRKASESMGTHDSEIVDAGRVD